MCFRARLHCVDIAAASAWARDRVETVEKRFHLFRKTRTRRVFLSSSAHALPRPMLDDRAGQASTVDLVRRALLAEPFRAVDAR